MYRRTIEEKIKGLIKEVGDGNQEAKIELLKLYRQSGKFKDYFKLLSTIRPLKDHEIAELTAATWKEFFQQARICEAQNAIDESLLEEVLAFAETDGLERINIPKSGIICWNCDDCCADFHEDRSNFLEIIRFIKQHEACCK
jgi:hypothetical protein